MGHILVVEDDKILSDLVCRMLHSLSHTYSQSYDGLLALDLISKQEFDLILLDIRVPGIDGLQLLSEIRGYGIQIPVIVVTSDISEQNELECFKKGSTIFHKKPIKTRLLRYQIASLLKEHGKAHLVDSYKELTINRKKKQFMVNNKPVHLSPIEYKIMKYLLDNRGGVVSKYELIESVFEKEAAMLPSSIDTTISRIRKKLDACKGSEECNSNENTEIIITQRGFGYRLY